MGESGAALTPWNGFYVMIGSSAAALTGLMFVVITLVGNEKRPPSPTGISTFSTPTVAHFCCALFTAAVMSAPFGSLVPVAILTGLAGAAGLIYVLRVALLTRTLETYRPDAEDWTWHFLLPMLAYALLLAGSITLHLQAGTALYAPASAVVLLIFIGIHNAWDVVTFLAVDISEPPANAGPPDTRG